MSDENDENGTFTIGVVSHLKHGEFLKSLERRGWTQHQGAEFLGLNDSSFGLLINMHWVPKKISAEFERKLFEFTGKLPEELWPSAVFTPAFMGASRKRVVVKDVPIRVLQATVSAMQLPPARPDEEFDRTERDELLERAIATLKPREQQVIRARFFEDRTLEQVAKEMGVIRERVRQIESKALRKLRHPSNSRRLRDFVVDQH